MHILIGFTVFILMNLITHNSEAQVKIQMINGKVIDASSYTVGDLYITYIKLGTNKSRSKKVDRYDVFSILKADSSEEMVYMPDSLDFSIKEAKEYIKGEQAAHLFYRKPANSIAAAAIGVGSSVLSFYALPVPMIYSVIIGRFNSKKLQLPDSYDQQLASTEPFRLGYQKSARNIKIQQSLKWGYISLGISLAAVIIYEKNK